MKILNYISVALTFILVSSFVIIQNDKEILMQEALEKRFDDYKIELLEKCQENAIAEAEMTVDSIISIELGAGPIDTLDFPRKPQKPVFESFDSLKQDSIKLEPLFEKVETQVLPEIQKDSSNL